MSALAGAVGGGLMGIIGSSINNWQNYQMNAQLASQQFGYNQALLGAQIQAQKDLTLMGQNFNMMMQANSFQHDRNMLEAQVQAQAQAQQNAINIKSAQLQAAGYTKADAVRMAYGQAPTRTLDWSGTRYYAPSAPVTGFSGGFSPSYTSGLRSYTPMAATGSYPVGGVSLSALRGWLPGRRGSWSPAQTTSSFGTPGSYRPLNSPSGLSLPKVGESSV
ncbi:VP2 [Norovirus GV]|nr:VP2 [Norovirus GV]